MGLKVELAELSWSVWRNYPWIHLPASSQKHWYAGPSWIQGVSHKARREVSYCYEPHTSVLLFPVPLQVVW